MSEERNNNERQQAEIDKMNKIILWAVGIGVVLVLVVIMIVGFSNTSKKIGKGFDRLDKNDMVLAKRDSIIEARALQNSERLDAHVDKFIETDGIINGLKNDIGDLQRAEVESKRVQDSLIKAGEAEKKRLANLYWQLNQAKKKNETAKAEAKKEEAVASSDKAKPKSKKKGGSSSFSFDDLGDMFEDMLGDF